MTAGTVKEFFTIAREELVKYPNQYSIGGLFLWGVSVLLFSIRLDRVWPAIPYLIIAHALAVLTIYAGLAKNMKGRRAPLAITIGIIILLLTLLIDILLTTSV